jgi:cysteine desulfurase
MIETSQIIYLDNNSTTPVDPIVFDEMIPFLKDNFANPSSTHYFGQQINKKVVQAREQIANFINSEPNELIFTSGSTEAINIALKGIAESYSDKGKHIITASTEHKAVLDTCKDLERKGFYITYLPVQPNGLIDLGQVQKAIRPDTILVSIMFINNETGVIQPIKEIAKIAHENGSLFMTDATQAVGKIEINVDDLDVDLLCFSGHKMYAPKGIGALFVRQRSIKIKLTPQIHGGGQEQGLRSGTLNVPGITALGKACELASKEMVQNHNQIAKLRDTLEQELLKLTNTFVNGDSCNRIFNTTNICFKGQDANVMIGRMKNIAVSNGSACSSAVVEPSHVLTAMGLSDEDAFASLRFSLGKFNTLQDIETVIQKIKNLIQPNYNYA